MKLPRRSDCMSGRGCDDEVLAGDQLGEGREKGKETLNVIHLEIAYERFYNERRHLKCSGCVCEGSLLSGIQSSNTGCRASVSRVGWGCVRAP